MRPSIPFLSIWQKTGRGWKRGEGHVWGRPCKRDDQQTDVWGEWAVSNLNGWAIVSGGVILLTNSSATYFPIFHLKSGSPIDTYIRILSIAIQYILVFSLIGTSSFRSGVWGIFIHSSINSKYTSELIATSYFPLTSIPIPVLRHRDHLNYFVLVLFIVYYFTPRIIPPIFTDLSVFFVS